MNSYKFYKITIIAIDFYLKGSLNEETLTDIISKIRLEKTFKNEDIYQETKIIKYLFSIKSYYEIENFCDEFIAFIFNMSCTSKKTQADIGLIVESLERIKEKINYRVHSQVDIHIYTLLKLNYIEGLNNKNISIILKNSSYIDNAIGIDLAESFACEQYSFFDKYILNNEKDEPREILSKNNEEIKCNIQEEINSLITEYYSESTLKKFINTLNKILGNINQKTENKRVISYLFNLKMQYYFKQARKKWQKKNNKAQKDIKIYTLPLNFK